ncbi:MAG: hypothetical protein HZC17_03620 [Candidatus Omnitrophica bacterium]|nr:hypothetical protein [Candidatus Omnitrophota bacterium]
MKQILAILMFSLFLISGCEMTIGIPKSENASAPKKVNSVELKAVEGRTPLEILQHDKRDVQTIAYPDWGSYVIQVGNVKNEAELGPEGRKFEKPKGNE